MKAETLGHQALKQVQERLELTNRQLAARIGVHPSALSHWFNKNRTPAPKTRKAIQKAVGITETAWQTPTWQPPVKPAKEAVRIGAEMVGVKSHMIAGCGDCPFQKICKASTTPEVLKMITGRDCLTEPIIFALPIRTTWVQCKPGEIKEGDIVRRKERPYIELIVKDVFINTKKFRDLMIVSNAEVDEALVKCENFEVKRTNGVL